MEPAKNEDEGYIGYHAIKEVARILTGTDDDLPGFMRNHFVGLLNNISRKMLYSDDISLQIQAMKRIEVAGAAAGALSIMELMPMQYKHMVEGPSLKVDLHTGAIAEGVLTFAITFIALFVILRGPRNPLLKNWLLAMSTVILVFAGSSYTGPSMNPAIAYGWAYVDKRHNTWEQFYVYWICPFVGAILSASFFRVIFPPTVKQKKA